jgi:hypothetical protein
MTRAHNLLTGAAESRLAGQAAFCFAGIYGNQLFTVMFANIHTQVKFCLLCCMGVKLGLSLSIIDHHYALIISPLFDTQALTCFGIRVPSSGSFLCPYKLLEGRNGYVVCHVL